MKHNYFLVALLATVSFSSCQDTDDILPAHDGNLVMEQYALEKISPDIIELSASDASKVAALFANGFEGSRSVANKSVSNVRTIVDENGVPALYAVNMADGYIIVSASKHTNPIKAVVAHGQFEMMQTGTGQDDVIQDMIAEVNHSRKFSQTDSVKREWYVFEKVNTTKEFKSRAMSQELYDAQDDFIFRLQNQGYETYYLRNGQPQYMPDDLYNEFVEYAMDNDEWKDTDDNAIVAGVIGVRYKYENFIEPVVKTKWDQGNPYNSGLSSSKLRLGCCTVAVGQLMKYFEYPKSYDWKVMPDMLDNVIPCKELTNFLSILRKELKIDNDGVGTVSDMVQVLKDYGYKTTLYGNIFIDRLTPFPLITIGAHNPYEVGHSWLICGKDELQIMVEYTLYLPSSFGYPDFFKYEEVKRQVTRRDYGNSHCYYYMNFGWGGNYDGWYNEKTMIRDDGYNNSEVSFVCDRQYITAYPK